MGIQISLGGVTLQASDYSVSESSTPLSAGDASGGTGSLTITFPTPDPYVERSGTSPTGWDRVLQYGPDILIGGSVSVTDSRKGYTVGTVVGVTASYDGASLTVICRGRLQALDVYNVQSEPFIGTLEGAFRYYCGLARISSGILVDTALAARNVVFPGWNGELWYNLKRMAAVLEAEVALVSGIIVLRPIRRNVIIAGRDITRGRAVETGQLAEAVEAYQYNNRAITNQLVYPPGGWTAEVEVLNVNAGETSEYTLELSSSLSSFQVPTMQTFVAQNHSASSVYTIVANDNLPVTPAMWTAQGGKVEISRDPSTTRLNVKLTGPSRPIPLATGGEASSFSLALSSGDSSRYSTLRIVGTGVRFDKQKVLIRTGATAAQTANEIGVTLDNPFMSTLSDVMRAGSRAAKTFAGAIPTLTGSVASVNARGDSGTETVANYLTVQAVRAENLYSTVQTSQGSKTYQQETDQWNAGNTDSFDNQVFGNVTGARVWDEKSRRWYRIREATITPGDISFSADDDLTYGDAQVVYSSRTYAEMQTARTGLTYQQVDLIGLK